MKNKLTKLEADLIRAIANQHPDWSFIRKVDLSSLNVVRREVTGVGAYVVLGRDGQLPENKGVDAQLGYQGSISVPGIPSGLGALLDITDGQMNHIEFFTYGDEEWDGDTDERCSLIEWCQ